MTTQVERWHVGRLKVERFTARGGECGRVEGGALFGGRTARFDSMEYRDCQQYPCSTSVLRNGVILWRQRRQ